MKICLYKLTTLNFLIFCLTLLIYGQNKTIQKEKKNSNEEIVKIETNLVNVPVSVIDREKKASVPALTKENFRLFENNEEREISFFSTNREPFTIVLMIDTSYSMKFQFSEVQKSAIYFLSQLRKNDKVILAMFDDKITTITSPTNDQKLFEQFIKRPKLGFSTRLYDSLYYILTDGLKTIQGRKAVVIFTDGLENGSRVNAMTISHILQESDALIYTIQTPIILGHTPFEDFHETTLEQLTRDHNRDPIRRAEKNLKQFAENSGGNYYYANSKSGLDVAFKKIAEDISEQYTLGFYPKKDDINEESGQIKIIVDRPKTALRYRRTFIFRK